MRWTIGKKLSSAFALILVIMIGMGIITMYKMYEMNRKVDELTNVWRPGLGEILQINIALETIYGHTGGLFSATSMAEEDMLIKMIDEQFSLIDHNLSAYEATIKEQEDRENFENLKKSLEDYKKFIPEYIALGKKIDITRAATPEEIAQLTELKTKSSELFTARKKYVDAIIAFNSEGARKAGADSRSLYQAGIRDNAIILVVSIIECLLLAYWLTRSIRRPILQLVDNMKEVAEGNLKIEPLTIKNRDEIKDLVHSFTAMTGSLQMLIRQVGVASEQVAASAEQLMASAEQTSQATEQITVTVQEVAGGTERQVESVERGSQSIGEMSQGIRQIAANTQQASAMSVQLATMAGEGNQSIQDAVKQMNTIQDSFHALSGVVNGLGNHSQAIGQIIEVITGIAEQTNLLALNAAIEAARAGEHGRGFAVVADEVRKLAEQSSHSAGQILQLINTIQTDTRLAVDSMEAGTKEVQAGILVVHRAGETFGQIQMSLGSVSDQIQDVSAAAQEVSAHSEQVVGAIQFISEVSEVTAGGTQNVLSVTEEQLAAMEEISSSSASLSRMAEELQQMIGRFRV